MYWRTAQIGLVNSVLTQANPLTSTEISALKNKIESAIATQSLSYLAQRKKDVQGQIAAEQNSSVYTTQNPPDQYNKMLRDIQKKQIFIDEVDAETKKRKLVSNPFNTAPIVQTNDNDNIYIATVRKFDPSFHEIETEDLNSPLSPLSAYALSEIQMNVNDLLSTNSINSVKPILTSLWKTIQFIKQSSAYNDTNNALYKKYRYVVKWYVQFIKDVARISIQRSKQSIGRDINPLSKSQTGFAKDKAACDSNPFFSVLCGECGPFENKLSCLTFLMDGSFSGGLSLHTKNNLQLFFKFWKQSNWDLSKGIKAFNNTGITKTPEFIESWQEFQQIALNNKESFGKIKGWFNNLYKGLRTLNAATLQECIDSPLLAVVKKWAAILGAGVGIAMFIEAIVDWIALLLHKTNKNWLEILHETSSAVAFLQTTPLANIAESAMGSPVLAGILDALAAFQLSCDFVSDGGLQKTFWWIINKTAWAGVGDQEEVEKWNQIYDKNINSDIITMTPEVSKLKQELSYYELLKPYIQSNNWTWIMLFLRNPDKLQLSQDFLTLRDQILKDYPWIMNSISDPNTANLAQWTNAISDPSYNNILTSFINDPQLSDIVKDLFHKYGTLKNSQIPSNIRQQILPLLKYPDDAIIEVRFVYINQHQTQETIEDISAVLQKKFKDQSRYIKFIHFINSNIQIGRLAYKHYFPMPSTS